MAQLSVYTRTMQDGGGTFRAGRSVTPKARYTTGTGNGDAAKLPIGGVTAKLLPGVLSAVSAAYNSEYVGTWVHDGSIIIDPVVFIDNLDEALSVARKYKQDAIFDNYTMEEISL